MLPARLDDQTLALVQEIASSPIPALAPCDDRQFMQCFRILHATLPSRMADDLAGELIVASYRRMLGQQPGEAISFLTATALAECRWFPTVAECLDILKRWHRDDEAQQQRDRARVIALREIQTRLDETMDRLAAGAMTQPEIDALPERWKRIAAERCHLWAHDDGTFSRRALPAGEETKA